MVLKTDQARIKALLKDTITLLCRNGLTFKTEFSIEALIGITLDKDDVVLVSINEVIRSELGAKLAAAQSSGQDPGIENATWNEESDEDPNGSIDVRRQHSPSVKRRRKRRRSTGRVSVTEETGEQDEGGEDDRSSISQLEDADDNSIHSEPPIKRTPGDATKNRNSIKEEYREEDDESKDIVFIKEEVDNWPSTGGGHGQDNFSDLSGIPSTSSQQEGFDFLQGGLLPVASQGAGASMWPELSHHQGQQSGHPSSGMGAAAKRTPTNTSSAMGSNADDSQQIQYSSVFDDIDIKSEVSTSDERPSDLVGPELEIKSLNETRPIEEETLFSEFKDEEGQSCVSNLIPNLNAIATPAVPVHSEKPGSSRTHDVKKRDKIPNVQFKIPQSATDSNKPGQICPTCGKRLTSPRGYKLHVEAHKGIFPHYCPFCKRGFLSQNALQGHLVVHTNKKEFKCMFCAKEFKYKNGLDYHQAFCPTRLQSCGD